MGEIKNLGRIIGTTAMVALGACTLPRGIESRLGEIKNSFDQWADQAQKKEIIERFLNEEVLPVVEDCAGKSYDLMTPDIIPRQWEIRFKNKVNALFGVGGSLDHNIGLMVEPDSFPSIDSTIVDDFVARYSSPLEIKPFITDTFEVLSHYQMYGRCDFLPSTKVALHYNAGVCLSASVSLIAPALEDDGYPPIVLRMYCPERDKEFAGVNIRYEYMRPGHAIYLYNEQLIGEGPAHKLYDEDFSLGGFSFREFMHEQSGWETAGINNSDFTGPHDNVEDIVEHFGYCRYTVLNLKDYLTDLKYSDSNRFYGLGGYEQAEYRKDLRHNIRLRLSQRVNVLINPFPENREDVMYAEDPPDSAGISLWSN